VNNWNLDLKQPENPKGYTTFIRLLMSDAKEGGIFYGLGRGIVFAILVFALPAYLVIRNYDWLAERLGFVIGLPIYDEMQENFMTGSQIVGGLFASKLSQFYQLDSLSTLVSHNKSIPAQAPQSSYWLRQDVENQLIKNFSSSKKNHAKAYLDYVEKYKDIALDEMLRSKIPASVTLAQGLLEGDAGRGYLAAVANNHFGVKCRLKSGYNKDGKKDDADFEHHNLAVDCVQRTDDYVWDRFEVYLSARESYRRHTLLLQNERYNWMIRKYEIGKVYTIARPLFGLYEVPYYAAWASGLKQSGYATAKNYAETVTLIIETYQLWRIDYELIANS
jgi:flagellum-specific peptidoglycan hydrolase FlgJ